MTKLMWQMGRWLVVAVAVAVVALMCSTTSAFAVTPSYFNKWSEIPSADVSFVSLGSQNMSITHSSDVTMTAFTKSNYYYPGYRFDVAKSYAGNGWISVKFNKGARDWSGRWIDVEFYVDNIRRSATTVNSNADSDRGAFNVTYLAATSCSLSFVDNSSNKGGNTSADCTIRLRYSDTGTMVNDHTTISFNDLDVLTGGIQEQIQLKAGFENTMYLPGSGMAGSGIDLNDAANNIIHGNHGHCNDETNMHCGAIFRTSGTTDFKFRWQGHDCATAIGIRSIAYPYDKIQMPTKEGDSVVHFDGERVTYSVETFWPYSNPQQRPSTVRWYDTLDPCLDYTKAELKVYQGGVDVTSEWTIHNDNSSSFCAHRGSNSLPMGAYTFVISAPIKTDFDFSSYNKTDLMQGGQGYLIPNVAQVMADEVGASGVVIRKQTNEAYGLVSWGKIAVTVSSSNDTVSQLGQNECYGLKGAQVGIYTDEACTKLVDTITLDANGLGESKRLPIGPYYVGEVKTPLGFAANATVDEVTIVGLETTNDDRVNDPQSEDLDGSIISKRDGELESIDERKNPVQVLIEDFVQTFF